MLLLACFTATALRAQTEPQPVPPRETYVFHIYVDPLFGDNIAATASNPTIASLTPPLGQHPDPSPPMLKPIGGILQQAPYSFRTLTGPSGALAYVQLLSSQFGAPPSNPFPWRISVGSPSVERMVNHVVIHCLPGVYGAGTTIDPRSGLPFNGETWPAQVPDNVSLQGTSILDTIFDAQGSATSILEFGLTFGTFEPGYIESFVDAIQFRGARSDGQPMHPFNRTGTAIYIGRECSVLLTVSNCVFTDNDVGVAIDSDVDPLFRHRPALVNNTFAWNRLGVWNGNTGNVPGQPNIGESYPILLNNIFDTGSPYGFPGTGAAAFEGIHPDDVTVASRTLGLTVIPVGIAFNAWALGADNPGGGGGGTNWPAPAVRAPLVAMPPPRVDLTPYIGDPVGGFPRGSLYVNDVLRNGSAIVGHPDLSPHDFRLAPTAALDPKPPPIGAASLNPLVNRGIYLPTDIPGGSTLTMQNSTGIPALDRVLTRPPGIRGPGDPTGGEDFATLHCFDWDGEGHGNPRVTNRPGYAPSPDFDDIDLGADEMGRLIGGGFIPMTRIFARDVPGAIGVAHLRHYFFERNDAGPYVRPYHNRIVGRMFPWWEHVQSPTDTTGLNNYTYGINSSWRWALAFPGLQPAFMRNLECDFTPHLFVDIQPLWGVLFSTLYTGPDVYASNPWHQGIAGTGQGTYDNPYVYYNPPPGYFPHTSPFAAAWLNVSFVALGVVHAPGTALFAIPSYLSSYLPISIFGPFGTCSSTTTFTVNAYGFGDSSPGCPDMLITAHPDLGVRFNCEIGPGESNLHTFLVIYDETQETQSMRSSGPAELPDNVDLEEIRRAGQRLLEAIRRTGSGH